MVPRKLPPAASQRTAPRLASLALCAVLLDACRAAPTAPGPGDSARAEVGQALDAFHQAAAQADEEAYFSLFAPEAVFLGTDPAERWTLAEFRAFAHPHFASGRGWVFEPIERHIELSERLDTAWFDERLSSASYGECRGTGVLRRSGRGWRVAQYSLSLPVPNELTRELVDRMRSRAGG